MQIQVIVNQILILSLITLIGIIGVKIKIITFQVKDSLAKLVFNITLPLLIFTTVSSMEFSGELFRDGLIVFVYAFLALILLYAAAIVSCRFMGLKDQKRIVHILHTMFGNIVFLGFPLFNALYPGGKGLFYAAIYQLAQDSIMWTFGIMMFNKNAGRKELIRHLVNPNTISFGLGILAMSIGFKLPYVFDKALSGLGHTTIFLSMLYIGSILAGSSLKELVRYKYAYVLSLNKMVVVPFLFILLIQLINRILGISLSEEAKTVLIMQAATPCMATIVVLAKQFNSDTQQATNNMFTTTIISIFSLPFVYWLIQIL